MTISFADLEALEAKERKLTLQSRRRLAKQAHLPDGDFIAMLGRQFKKTNLRNPALKPLWGGFFLHAGDLEMMVDPGVSTLTRAESLGINLTRTNTLFISHAHLDHANDASVVMEMTGYQPKNRKVQLLLSRKALQDRAVSHYHAGLRGKGNVQIDYLDGSKNIGLAGRTSLNPVKVFHSIDGSYGFVLKLRDLTIGYTGDTGFFRTFVTPAGEYPVSAEEIQGQIDGPGRFNTALADKFADVDILVFNLHTVGFRRNSKHSLYHASVNSLVRVLKGSRVSLCIVDHFNPYGSLGSAYPKKVCQYVKQETGKDVRLVPLGGGIYPLT